MKDAARAKAPKLRDPRLEQIRGAITAMPDATAIDRRNRALIALDEPIANPLGWCLQARRPAAPLRLAPAFIARRKTALTKFAKAIVTYFFPGRRRPSRYRNGLGR
jgi:hypothetical protein